MNTQHTPEPTRYSVWGKYLQEQPNGEYIKACHYDVMKQQHAELLDRMRLAVRLIRNGESFTADTILGKAIAKAGSHQCRNDGEGGK